jgi:hypothetical protein
MNRVGLGFLALGITLAGGLIAGCKSKDGGNPDGGKTLPDGFVSTTCSSPADCDGNVCQVAKCNAATHMCEFDVKHCDPNPMDDPCTTRMCDPSTAGGDCAPTPLPENSPCTTPPPDSMTPGDPGICMSGVCTPVPNCLPPSGFTFRYASCDPGDASVTQDNNDTTMSGSAVVGSYACAPNEAGPEVAWQLSRDPSAGDEDVTIVLRPVNADGTPATSDNKDLDLIILEDSCTGMAKCMNPMNGSGYQGITAGTANERVTFHTTAGKNYYVVVDGKDMNQTRDFVIEIEACGKCQPTDTTRLSCNMTMPISGNTSTGTQVLDNYKCGMAMTAVSAPGKEIPFYFRTDDNAARNVTANLTGATADYRLVVLPDDYWGACDPTSCVANAAGPAATNSVTWKVDAGFSAFTRYWVVVDTPAMADTSFGLELSCGPTCLSPYELDCGGSFETKTADGTTIGGSSHADHYGPTAGGCDGLSGLTGPDTALMFVPTIVPASETYTFQLSSNTAGVNLSATIVDAGTMASPACDPTLACVANTPAAASSTITGTHTTSGTKIVQFNFTALKGHTYFIVVDGPAGAGADFSAKIVGANATAGCQ